MERKELIKIVNDIKRYYQVGLGEGLPKQTSYVKAYTKVSSELDHKLTKEEADFVIKKLNDLREEVYNDDEEGL